MMWLFGVDPEKYVDKLPAWIQDTGPAGYACGVAAVSGAGIISLILRHQLKKWNLTARRKKTQVKCKKSLQALEDELASGMLTAAQREEITKLSLMDLVAKLQSGSLKPSEALEAYQAKALSINKDINCIVEPITEARARALELDKQQDKGPLYGVPISLKDNYGIQGYDCGCGMALWLDNPYERDAVIVQVLKEKGAIPFVKTNVPQTMISWESTNPVNGATRNPHDVSRGVGGSSGGEAAIIGGGGSLLGFGSDVGGSIRIPASLCGVCGLKPTYNRLSSKGCAPLGVGQNCVPASYGPLANDVDSLVFIMRTLLDDRMFALDPSVPSIPFRNEMFESKKPLKIGYFCDGDFFNAVPAMQRGVLVAKAALEKRGHVVDLWDYPKLHKTAVALWGVALFGDGGKELRDLLRHDKLDSAALNIYILSILPVTFKKFLYRVIKFIYPGLASMLLGSCGKGSVSEWWDVVGQTMDFKQAIAEDWQKKGFDAVICPGFGCPALPLHQAVLASGAACYTMLYNVLDFPAGSMPVTKISKEDVDKVKSYPTPDPWHAIVKKGMKGSEGLPVNIQVAALHWRDETVLRVMKEVEIGLKN